MSKSNGKDRTGRSPFELPLLNLPSAHPCHECGDCCRYIALEIDDPTSFTDHDNIYWYLAHRDVSVYVDFEGDWFVEFVTVCENLSEEITCSVYEDRPKMCSDFSWDECERTTGEPAWKYRFEKPEEYHNWHLEKRPRSFERYVKSREKMKRRRQSAKAQSGTSVPDAAQTGSAQVSETSPS